MGGTAVLFLCPPSFEGSCQCAVWSKTSVNLIRYVRSLTSLESIPDIRDYNLYENKLSSAMILFVWSIILTNCFLAARTCLVSTGCFFTLPTRRIAACPARNLGCNWIVVHPFGDFGVCVPGTGDWDTLAWRVIERRSSRNHVCARYR